ncbi:MAG: hypothetical protein QOH56_608, partial [Pseudonocardiales bacterium]|nr:hypothetical protein [Pseudonocardiales bacterium]
MPGPGILPGMDDPARVSHEAWNAALDEE